MPKGGRKKYKEAPSVSVDENTDGTLSVTVGFEQDDGAVRYYTYTVPKNTVDEARRLKSLEPIIDWIASKIADNYGGKSGTRTLIYNNSVRWIRRRMSEDVLDKILSGRQTSLSEFYGNDYGKKQSMRRDRVNKFVNSDNVHKEILEFIGSDNKDSLWYTVFHQDLKKE